MKEFNRRTPKSRYGNKVDTTKMRWVDTATDEEIAIEYELIKQKQSNLPSNEREFIKNLFKDGK